MAAPTSSASPVTKTLANGAPSTHGTYCIDRLREAFVQLAGRDTPSSRRLDDNGELRIVAVPVSLENLAYSAFAAVLRYAASDADVLTSLTKALDKVIREVRPDGRARLLALRGAAAGKIPE